MIQDSGRPRPGRGRGAGDAHGLAVLLVAVLLAVGTGLLRLGAGGPAFPQPSGARAETRTSLDADTLVGPRMAGQPAGLDPGQSKPRPPSQVNINTADAEALQALPGIGPALAERIVADREARGPFRTPEDLLRVPGVGPKRWERIRPLVQLTEAP